MKTVFITGGFGFVGTYFCNNFSDKFIIDKCIRSSKIKINSEIVLHFAGKSHDLKGLLSSDDYFIGNYALTKEVFDAFLVSNAKVFITISSVKAVADIVRDELDEVQIPNPSTIFGKSKLLAEQYIFSKEISDDKRVYILRPCMIHGPGNKGNLNLLFKFVLKNMPWPLGAFDNKRSYCSIDNLMFIINELIERYDITSGIYNVSDDQPVSTNELISLIANSLNRKPIIWKISKKMIKRLAVIGDKLNFPLNTKRLHKLTSSYVVSNSKIKNAINKSLPISSREGFLKTFKSFSQL